VLSRSCAFPNQRLIVAPGAGTEDGRPPGVTKVGYVPVLKPLLRPFDDPVVLLLPLLIPVVPVLVELPKLLAIAPPAVVSPVVPAPTAPAPCARAMDELIARTEAKASVASFMCGSLPRWPRWKVTESDGPASGAG
jgi:hypothetical protein